MNQSFPIGLILAFFLTQGLRTSAQSPIFGVFYTTGNIKFSDPRGGGGNPPGPVFPHTWLYPDYKLMLYDNVAEITLFARDSSYLRLHGKGNYTIAELAKLPRTRIHDSIMVHYFSLAWEEVIPPHSPKAAVQKTPFTLAPRAGYATSLDSIIFCWHTDYRARKYFLRLRSPDGQAHYDSVTKDTLAVVHFPGHMPFGNIYSWTLELVGESGRLQFADSGHIILVDESAVLPQLPPTPTDSLGAFAPVLEQIGQYERAGCTKRAQSLLYRLTTDFPQDGALDKLYLAFRRRNYF